MAKMKPSEVDKFHNDSEKQSYELLQSLDETYTVVYEPSTGIQKRRTPDFILLSEKYGLIVLDVKYVNLNNIKESDKCTITKTSGDKIQNFYKIVQQYAYSINNQLVKELKDNSSIVHPASSKMSGKLTFPHSSGLLLFIQDEGKYTKEEVAKILALNEKDFLIINKVKNPRDELVCFLENLNRPFEKSLTSLMQDEILKKIYINSDAESTEFINTMSQFNLSLNKNFKNELNGTVFEKSQQLKINLLEYAKFTHNTIEVANKNLGLGCENIIERLKDYRQELEDEKFTIAVFGYFSTGKSTFLNALMGTDKLPMDEDRSTATFTRLRHCDESDIYDDGDMEVIYKSKLDIELSYKSAVQVLPFDDDKLEKYLKFNDLENFKDDLTKALKSIKIIDFNSSDRDKIKNAKKTLDFIINNNIPYGIQEKVAKEDIKEFLTNDKKAFTIAEVIYYLNNDLLKYVEVVATPGYGSENTMDTYKTEEFVQEANVLILLTEAKDPMSKKDEQNFLEVYAARYKDTNGEVNTENLFVVANKVDDSTKNVQQIKESIKEKIKDNWEESLVLKDEQIFTMSSKFHYNSMHKLESNISSVNINESDLEYFINCYSGFLTENKNKELVRNSFKNIDDTIKTLNKVFDRNVHDINMNLNNIRDKKALFEQKKEHISKQYNLYSESISSIPEHLKKFIRENLDKQKLNDETRTAEAYKRFLDYKGLKSRNANKENSKEFYNEFVTKIHESAMNENFSSLKTKINADIEFINSEIEQLTITLEAEYTISGLDKTITLPNIINQGLKGIEFEKGFARMVLDFIMFGQGEFVDYYARQMCKAWEEKTYADIVKSIDDANKALVSKTQQDFNYQTKSIVESIGNKLNDLERNIIAKQKDKAEYDKKIEMANSHHYRIPITNILPSKPLNSLKALESIIKTSKRQSVIT